MIFGHDRNPHTPRSLRNIVIFDPVHVIYWKALTRWIVVNEWSKAVCACVSALQTMFHRCRRTLPTSRSVSIRRMAQKMSTLCIFAAVTLPQGILSQTFSELYSCSSFSVAVPVLHRFKHLHRPSSKCVQILYHLLSMLYHRSLYLNFRSVDECRMNQSSGIGGFSQLR